MKAVQSIKVVPHVLAQGQTPYVLGQGSKEGMDANSNIKIWDKKIN